MMHEAASQSVSEFSCNACRRYAYELVPPWSIGLLKVSKYRRKVKWLVLTILGAGYRLCFLDIRLTLLLAIGLYPSAPSVIG